MSHRHDTVDIISHLSTYHRYLDCDTIFHRSSRSNTILFKWALERKDISLSDKIFARATVIPTERDSRIITIYPDQQLSFVGVANTNMGGRLYWQEKLVHAGTGTTYHRYLDCDTIFHRSLLSNTILFKWALERKDISLSDNIFARTTVIPTDRDSRIRSSQLTETPE